MKKKNKGGFPATDGVTATKRKNVSLDVPTIKKAEKLGDGNLSLGIRRAVRAAP